jgi:hypothetical protein
MSVFQPLSGRDCGDCAACCVELAIDDPELQKPDEVPCPHLAAHGCTVYERRPHTCRTWYCGWRLIALGDDMRPDRSKVLMIPEMGDLPGYERGGLKLSPIGADLRVLLQDELVDFVGKCVARDIPIWLTFGAGPAAKRLLVNDLLKPAVRVGDRAGFVQGMRAALAQLEARVKAEAAG